MRFLIRLFLTVYNKQRAMLCRAKRYKRTRSYEIRKNEWLDDLDSWPSLTYIHVGMYLLFNARPYTQEQLMNYISLDCYQNFANGWVREVFSKKFGENRLRVAKVRSENRLQSCFKVFTSSRGKCFGLFDRCSIIAIQIMFYFCIIANNDK